MAGRRLDKAVAAREAMAEFTEDEIESIRFGQTQIRWIDKPPAKYRATRKALKAGAAPEDVSESGRELFREVAEKDGISEREAYGWLIGYPPDFGFNL